MAKKQKTASFILTLPLDTNESDSYALDKYLELSRKYYNAILGKLLKRYYLMIQCREYIKVCNMEKSKERNELFNEIEIKFGLRGEAINKLITSLRVNEYRQLGSHITIKLQLRAMQAINNMRFGEGEDVHFIKYGDMKSFEGSDNKQGIKYRDGFIIFNKLKLKVYIKPTDGYAQTALESRIKYCRILKKQIRGKDVYYAQLILEGIPPQKRCKDNCNNLNVVGLDIGIQTIAISSETEVKLLELAPSINNIDKEMKVLQRKMDRSKRAMNPNKYNSDGTINKHNKEKWIFSNRYKKIKLQRKELYRKQSEMRKQDHNILANHIVSLGNTIKVEKMNYKGLQKRAKKTTINSNGKYNKKKRFGKSLANKAPSMLLTMVDMKLKYKGLKLIKIDTTKVKASQYNHITNDYHKKKLSERWNDFGSYKIQRDLYSAFLIQHVDDDLSSINRQDCIADFDNFKSLHNIEIDRLTSTINSRALKNVM